MTLTHTGTDMDFRPTGYSGQSNPQPVLKPCPFCGRERGVELRHYIANGNDWWYVACNHCVIAMDPLFWGDQTKNEAIERWNRRVN